MSKVQKIIAVTLFIFLIGCSKPITNITPEINQDQDPVAMTMSAELQAKYEGYQISWPTEATKITQPFHATHKAIDIAYERGSESEPTYIYSAFPGKVTKTSDDFPAKSDNPDGNYVVIEGENGLIAKYSNLASFTVKTGDEVINRELIGGMGTTGHSTGPHLHFELTDKDGNALDPLFFLPKR